MAETLRIEIPIETMDNTDPELSNVTKKLEKMEKAAEGAGNAAQKAEGYVSKFDQQAEKTQKSLLNWAKEKYEILLEAKERITPVLASAGSKISSFTGKTWNVTLRAIDFVTSPVRGIINLLKNPIFQVGAVLGVSIGLKDTIETYKDFEVAMSQVQAISGATGSELTRLTNKAKEMGATTKFTATESAEAFNYMAMAGWKTADMLDGIEGILSLAAASGEELAKTSDIVTDGLTAFKMQANESGHFSDVLAAATSNANTTISEMGETFKYAGTMAGTLRYSIEDVALATGLMSNSSIKGTMAGTALNSIFTRLSTNTSGARDALEELGISFFNTDGSARDLSDVIEELREATANYSDQQKSSLANTIAGMEAQKGLLAILNASTEDYNKLSEAVNNADGAAQRMSETMMDNLQGSITLLQSAVDGVKISLGERLSTYVRSGADWLTEQMPAIEQGLTEFMDWLDVKITRMQRKYSEMTDTREWQDSGIFGKMKIAWDEFIGEPFSEWWNSKGKQMISDAAGSIGNAIGTGISSGIMMLLGIDVSDSVSEGASIGKAFADGFAEGFDFDKISGKLWEGIKGMFSSAAKLLPGGESADLSSVMSALVLAKMGAPLLKIGGGAFSLGQTLFGAGAGGTSLVGSILGSTGNAMVGGSGILGGLANVGYGLSGGGPTAGMYFGNMSGAMSGGAAALTGAGAVAGGVIGGAALISGIKDFYKSATTDNQEEAQAYGQSGAWKMAGVASGAAAGAALGSIIPGLGTVVGGLIGAGVGGISGWIKGNKVKAEYEENMAAAQEASEKAQKVFEATGMSLNDVTFETQALNDALNDAEVSAEELGVMLQEAVSEKLAERFGSIHLSLTEIREAASKIVFGEQADSVDRFSIAVQDSKSKLAEMQSYIRELDKMNWKAGMGLFDSDELQEYKSAMEELSEKAKSYLTEKHYEASSAVNLLFGGEVDMDGLDNAYAGIQSQIDNLGGQLSAKMEIAIEDGVITLDEQSEIENLQRQITEITDKVSQAQEEAKFSAMKIKYGGGALDAESFSALQEELAANTASMKESYDNALEVSLSNLHLQRAEGAIDEGEFDRLMEEITNEYEARIDELQVRVESFQLDSIAEAFGSELDGILPDIQGTVSEKLKTVMDMALANNSDAASWTVDDIVGWFGLGGLSGNTQMAVAELLQKTAASIPKEMIDSVSKEFDAADMSRILSGIEMIYNNTGTQIDDVFSEPFNASADVNVALNWNLTNPTTGLYVSSSGSSLRASFSGGNAGGYGGISAATGLTGYAGGGYASAPQLSWLAEEGYGEFIIPTNPSRRTRALELYEQAGKALGVSYHADGGYVGDSRYSEDSGNTYASETGVVYGTGTSGEGTSAGPIQITVTANPEFIIQGNSQSESEEEIMQVIRRHMREMADELGGEIAGRLEEVFSNMPLKRA